MLVRLVVKWLVWKVGCAQGWIRGRWASLQAVFCFLPTVVGRRQAGAVSCAFLAGGLVFGVVDLLSLAVCRLSERVLVGCDGLSSLGCGAVAATSRSVMSASGGDE